MSKPLEKVLEMLSRHRLAENISNGQDAPRQEVVATLLHRQHLAELHNLLVQLNTEEVSSVLESLSIDDAAVLWSQVPEARQNEILWEVSDARREQLVGSRAPAFEESQLNAFALVEGRLRQIPISSRKDLDGVVPIWIDLLNSTKSERTYVGSHFGLSLPDPSDATELEVSTRFHIEESHDVHLHSNFLLDREGKSRSVPVSFIVHQGTLFTLRNEELPVFRLQRRRALTQPGFVTDCHDVIIDLYGSDVEYSADSLEDIYGTLGKVGKQVLSETISDNEAAAILGDIAEEEDLNGRIRGNILDTQRAIHFLMRSKILSPEQIDDAKQILSNIDSLNSHTAFLFDKINFLMDATIGFININQNKRINKLTVFGVVFMPINILAGMGGMSEFSMMTQGIPWPVAYGMFSFAAVLIGAATYWALRYFERRQTKT
jgi:magnesium transporter